VALLKIQVFWDVYAASIGVSYTTFQRIVVSSSSESSGPRRPDCFTLKMKTSRFYRKSLFAGRQDVNIAKHSNIHIYYLGGYCDLSQVKR
jgi:hypothetical protein